MASFTGQLIKDTYDAILKAIDNGVIDSTAKNITDGVGNVTPLFISTTQVGIGVTPSTDFHVNGSALIGGSLTITGDLTVNGSTTTISTQTLSVEDPLIILAKDNAANSVDIGFYGKYVDGSTKYAGLFRKAGDNKFHIFSGLGTEPTTTVNTGDASYVISTLVGNLEGNVTGNLIATGAGATQIMSDVRAVTQSANDNSTKIATTAYVDTSAGNFLPLAGGTMSGSIAMGGNNISGGGTATFTSFVGALTGNASTSTKIASITNSDIVQLTSSQTLTNKTIDVDNNTVSNIEVDNLKSGVLDTDLNSVSGSDDTIASAKSIVTFVNQQVTAQDLDFAGGSGTGAVDLDSQTFTIAGTTNEIETSASGQTLTVGLPSTVAITTKITSPIFGLGDGTSNKIQFIGGQGNWRVNISDSANQLVIHSESLASDYLTVKGGGTIQLNAYGSGSRTGTVAKNLAVDSSGNIIETDGGVVDGDGTPNDVAMWSDANTLTDAPIAISGNNATFAGDITLGDTSSENRELSIQTNSEKNSVINLKEGSNLFGFSLGYYGVANDFIIKRHDNSASGTDVLTLNRDDNNATFTGDVTATSKKFISTSSSSGDYVRLYAGSGTAQWDIYGSGENLRLSENSSGGGLFQVDSGATFAGTINITGTNDLRIDNGSLTSSQSSTTNPVARFTNTNVNNYDFTFPNSTTLQLSSNIDSDLLFKIANAGTGDFNLDVGGDANFAGSVKIAKASANLDLAQADGGSHFRIELDGADDTYISTIGGNPMYLRTDQTTALTIDASQNCLFESNISVSGTTFLDGDVTVGDTSSAFIGLARAGLNYIAATNASGQLVFRTGGTTAALTIDDSQNVELKSDAGNATKFLRIHNQGTAANDDAVLSWQTQLSRTYSMGIHRDSGNLVISNQDASVASSELLTIDNSGNSIFTGNVSINSTSSAAKNLVVEGNASQYGTIRVLSNSTGHGAEIEFGDSTDADYGSITQFASSAGEGGRMRFRAGGIETMNLRGGNLGLGTDSPDGKLQVTAASSSTSNGNDASFKLYLTNTDTTNNNYSLINFTDSDGGSSCGGMGLQYTDHTNNYGELCFITRGASGYGEKMRLDSSGNLGISNTSPSSYNSNARNLVVGSGGQSGITIVGGTTGRGSIHFADGTSGSDASRGFVVYRHDNNDMLLGTNDTLALTIDNSGNCLFAGSVDVGNFTFSGSGIVADAGMTLQIGGGSVNALTLADSTGNATFAGIIRVPNGTVSNPSIVFDSDPDTGIFRNGTNTLALVTAGENRININASGDVLFGATSLGNDFAYFDAESNNRRVLNIGSSSTSQQTLVNFRNPNGVVGELQTDGSTTSFVTSSDYRLKENVVEMTDALDRVSQLKPSRFNFIANPDKTYDGFLAHEVQDIVPEAISGDKDEVDEDGNKKYQGIDQSKLVPLLVGAIQELRAEIEILKTKINN